MKYFRYMWIGRSLDGRRTEVFRKLKSDSLPKSVYVLAVPETDTHVLDIYPGNVLKHKYFKKSQQIVIGLAGSYDEAQELSGSIVSSVYLETGSVRLLDYLEKLPEDAYV
ncbi:MAG: hypothetical protein IJL78_02660 [Lachnospiraceae bacterium]|nr:hypothetical protein [Lachnospiraceae bacterium]